MIYVVEANEHSISCQPLRALYSVFVKFNVLKSDSHHLKKLFCFNESALKMMKNVFYFMSKSLQVL